MYSYQAGGLYTLKRRDRRYSFTGFDNYGLRLKHLNMIFVQNVRLLRMENCSEISHLERTYSVFNRSITITLNILNSAENLDKYVSSSSESSPRPPMTE